MRQRKHEPMINVAPSYKGGHTALIDGYVHEFCADHPGKNMWGYVPQHRLVMEDRIGRLLRSHEVVHHKDENRSNNHPDNLQVMTKSEHHRHHALINRRKAQERLTEEMVRDALNGRTLKQAAAILGVHTQTLRNRFPDILAPRKRKTPTHIDDPTAIATVLFYASNPNIGLREVAKTTGIAAMTVKRICERHGLTWTKKTRKGEKRRTYRGKPTKHAESILGDFPLELVLP